MKEIYNSDIVKEFYAGAKPATAFINATESLENEAREKLIDEYIVKKDQVWNELGHQVFGAEVLK